MNVSPRQKSKENAFLQNLSRVTMPQFRKGQVVPLSLCWEPLHTIEFGTQRTETLLITELLSLLAKFWLLRDAPANIRSA